MSLSTALAKALFDNAAESPEELAFRKGDILMVLDQEGGGPGWWLCSLHGRQGIAPANRLRLLNTSQSSSTPAGEGAAPCSTVAGPHSEDSVYLSPTPHPWPDPAAGVKDVGEGVYLSPPLLGATATAAAALRRGDGRPRSHSSSGSRPRADWEACAPGRARSPSLRGRGSETGASKQQTLYQTPTAHKTHGGLAPEAVYLSPFGIPRAATDGPSLELGGADVTYLVPREAVVGVGNCEGCYLVPRVSTAPSEDVYQTPTGGAAGDSAQGGFTCSSTLGARRDSLQSASVSGSTLTARTKPAQEDMGFYQTPTLTGGLPKTPQNGRKIPGEAVLPPVTAVSGLGPQRLMASSAEGSPRPQPKAPHKMPGSQSASPMPPSSRGRLPQAPLRNSPVLPRMAGAKVQGSPNFSRKPPPPAPPVRGVTKKEAAQTQPCAQVTGQRRAAPDQLEGQTDGRTKEEESAAKTRSSTKKDDDEGEYEEPDDEDIRSQVYDTPPTSRWQQSVPAALPVNDDSIYNTPRVLPPQSDQGSEVYDVPALALSKSPDLQQPAYNIPGGTAGAPEGEDDVYSVPTLPGLSAVPGEVPDGSALEAERHEVYCVPGPGKCVPLRQNDGAPCPEVPIEGCECDCGIYDMPALSLDVPLSSTRRSSVSSTGSGDIQWRTSLSALIQSVLSSASSSTPPRELVASLTEILSVWKGCQAAETSPPLMQAWSRLSDIVSVLSTSGSPSPSEAQLSLVRRTLEDLASLLQSQALPPLGRPRLPSQESLSRRPLPALPVAEVKPLNVGMGGRKGSWIQERPLPPPPTPSFPLRPAAPAQPGASEEGEGDDLGNEYAGIGLTSTPAPFTGDSVGYVKLQGKPEPPAVIQTEETPLAADPSSAEQRLSPSPPLPVSLSLEDSELLSFYSSQSLSHLSCLADSIDALFTSVQGNQPPRVFVSRGKSLIVTAHKLVFIGDTLSRLLTSPDLRTKVTTSGGRLCQALKAVVVATKGAAQNYPSVPATQEMVDRVAELSQHAAGFSGLLQRLAEIS